MVTIKGYRTKFSKIETVMRRKNKIIIANSIKRMNFTNIRDYTGSTLLHLAIDLKNSRMLKFFIDNGCDVNAQDRNGTTPLLAAYKLSSWISVMILLEAKANIFLADNKGINALKLALKFEFFEFLEFFTDYLKVCGRNAKELAPELLEAEWSIYHAVDIGNSELIKLMIEAGSSVNSRDNIYNTTALQRAIWNCDVEITKILLEYGADCDISPFICATTNPSINPKIFDIFLKNELQRFNTNGIIKCFSSFDESGAEIIELLGKYKVNLTTKDKFGTTILHYLVSNRDQAALDLISKAEVDVNFKDNRGEKPLYAAACSSHIKCVKVLIDKGADVDPEDLIDAVNSDAPQAIIEILLKNSTTLHEETQYRILYAVDRLYVSVSVISPVLKQMAIMHLLGEAVSTRNEHLIKSNSVINRIFSMYLRELFLMKQKKITANVNISVFDILLVSENQLSCYARNEKMVKNFFEIQVCHRYPIYGKIVMRRFRRACIKQNWTENAIDILSYNIKQLNCNLESIANIVKFFSTNDLATLSINKSS